MTNTDDTPILTTEAELRAAEDAARAALVRLSQWESEANDLLTKAGF